MSFCHLFSLFSTCFSSGYEQRGGGGRPYGRGFGQINFCYYLLLPLIQMLIPTVILLIPIMEEVMAMVEVVVDKVGVVAVVLVIIVVDMTMVTVEVPDMVVIKITLSGPLRQFYEINKNFILYF